MILCLHLALDPCLEVICTGESKKGEKQQNKNTNMRNNYAVTLKISFPTSDRTFSPHASKLLTLQTQGMAFQKYWIIRKKGKSTKQILHVRLYQGHLNK